MSLRKRQVNFSDVAEITLMSPGDILFLYTDGVYDGSDEQDRLQLERVMRDHKSESAKDICNAILQYAVKQDEYLQQIKEVDRIDDKTVFIIKRK
jgi:serine phosphatase RsbU (regulator of sigma subunit)